MRSNSVVVFVNNENANGDASVTHRTPLCLRFILQTVNSFGLRTCIPRLRALDAFQASLDRVHRTQDSAVEGRKIDNLFMIGDAQQYYLAGNVHVWYSIPDP